MIPSENFVSSLAGLHHFHVPRHFPREQEEAHRIMTHHRLGHRLNCPWQRIEDVVSGDADAMVFGPEPLCDQIRMLKFVARNSTDAFEADRKRFDTVLAQSREQSD